MPTGHPPPHRRLKRLWLVALLLPLIGLVWFVMRKDGLENPETEKGASQQVQRAATGAATEPAAAAPGADGNGDSGALNLALKSISLSQGEGGFELWRLKAEWANMEKANERVIVEKPRLTYFMQDGGNPLFVESVTGSIDQKTQTLRFIDAVRVSQEQKLLTSDMLVYNGEEKTMSFPYGGEFSDTGVSGTAKRLVWRINEKRIEASGGVTVYLQQDPAKPPS